MNEYVQAICLAGSLIGLAWLFSAWRTYWIAEVRDDLFFLRQRLFLYAVSQGLVDHEAHQLLRRLVNSMTQYAHELSLTRYAGLVFGVTVWKDPKEKPETMARWERSLAHLTAEQRNAFETFHSEVGILIIRQIVKTSVSLRLLVGVVTIWDWATKGKTTDAPTEMAQRIPTGLIEEDALCSAAA